MRAQRTDEELIEEDEEVVPPVVLPAPSVGVPGAPAVAAPAAE